MISSASAMRLWTLLTLLASAVLLAPVIGARDKGADLANTSSERDCCAALLLEGEEGTLDAAGKYRLPAICRGVVPEASCPQLLFPSPATTTGEPASLAYQNQANLRTDPSCSRVEWDQRCPPGATMLLSKTRGWCRAASCVFAMEDPSVKAGEQSDDELLRVITAQVTFKLEAAKPDMPPSFYSHVRGLRRSFGKAEKRLLRRVEEAMKATPPLDIERVRYLTEVAATNGFRGGKLEEAITAVAKHDRQQAGIALIRSVPGRLMSEAARVAKDARMRSDAQLDMIASLKHDVRQHLDTIKGLRHAAMIDAARLASERTAAKTASNEAAALAEALRHNVEGLERTVSTLETAAADDTAMFRTLESDLRSELAASDGAIDALKSTVQDLEGAAEVAAELSVAAIRALEHQLENCEREASQARASTLGVRRELASCEDDAAAVDEASSALSLLAAQLGGGLQPATSRPAEPTTWEPAGLSAAREARQRTCARLDSVRTTVRTFAAKLEVEQQHRHGLEEELLLLETQVDEAETAADSCSDDVADLDTRTAAVLVALQEGVGDETSGVERLDSSAPAGATYERIRTRLEAIQKVALSFVGRLADDLSVCNAQLQNVEERAMDRLEEMMACEAEARETDAAYSGCAAGLKRLDSQSLDLVLFLADAAQKAGAPAPFAEALEAPKPPAYGLLGGLFRRQAASNDAAVTGVPARVGARFDGLRDMTAAVMSKFEADMTACVARNTDSCNCTGPGNKAGSSSSGSGSSSEDSTDGSADSADTESGGPITDTGGTEDKPIAGDSVTEEAESGEPIDDGNDPPVLGES